MIPGNGGVEKKRTALVAAPYPCRLARVGRMLSSFRDPFLIVHQPPVTKPLDAHI